MSYVVPRYRSSIVRTGKIPVVEHPSSRAWKTEELSICGTPPPFLRRENTLGGYPTHHHDPGYHRTLDVRYTVDDDTPRLLQYPPEYLQKPGRPRVKFQDTHYTKGSSDLELIGVIQDKLTNGYHGLKHMFRSNDPSGQGKVSRDALLKIFYNLFGYITREQFENILRRLGLERLQSISFDRFISCFKDNEVVQREAVKPLKHITILENIQPMYCTPAYAANALREKLHTGIVDIHDILPESCFLPNGYVVPPQLREALAQIGVRLCNDDFPKVWLKFDRQNIGALQTSQLFRELDLDYTGQPKVVSVSLRKDTTTPNSTTRHRSEVVTSRTDWVDKYTHDPHNGNVNLQRTKTTVNQTEKKVETTESTELPAGTAVLDPKMRYLEIGHKSKPKLDNVVDELHYKFENAYHALLSAFKLFDSMGDGYIARVDFRQVLRQFGFNIAAVDLEHFLLRAGLTCIQGQVSYRDFLHKYQSRSDNSLTAQVMSNRDQCVRKNGYPAETLSAVELEARVVDYLHSDFITLFNQFRMLDKNNIGVVSQFDFRNALERATGCQISEVQWDQLKMDLGLGASGALINYQTFLQRFDTEPGSWNTRHEGAYNMPRYPNVFTPPPQLDILRERAKTCYPRVMDSNKTNADGTRALPELERQVHELLSRRADAFEKQFQEMDRKVTGRMTKWQFGALLKIAGLSLSTRELDQLWNSMPVEADNMFSYNGLLQHFNLGHRSLHSPTHRDISSGKSETQRRVQQEKKDKEKQVELERIARRAEMERLHKEKQTDQAAKRAERERRVDEKRGSKCATPFDTARMDEMANAKLNVLYQQKITCLLQKIKPQVMNQRDYLKTYFQTRDRMGFSHISVDEMKGVMDRLYFNLLEDEKWEVCRQFDLNGNGRFHYGKFMDAFNGIPMSCESVNQSNKLNQSLQRKHNYAITVSYAKCTMQEKLLTEWKNLRRAFKKYDKNNDGLLDLPDLKKVLRQCKIPFNDEDLYHILSEFDANMDGKISYDEFLKTLLTS
ncbi:EF-hand calcium-binding domain-containing protein 6-like isoform X2 [Gigantopelta aegis]|uniref:EF-hand calcium-binding domain-containing protein 6-like isoform X2 n=1 Tax=Gigantopelta aegis TaxID=1735272 RepID=UPI001B88D942|nr:EF-hand calcium-binding domain-containing protein 6-like isoform X2 [Gigantopelta aegis]